MDDRALLLDCIRRDTDAIQAGDYEPEPGFFHQRRELYRRDFMQMEQVLMPELTTEQRQRLDAILATYQELKADADLLNEAIDEEKSKAYELLKEAGVESAQIGNVKLTEVGGDSSSFDKQKFVALGGDLAIYNQAIVKKPKKKYLKITVGEEKDKGTE